MPHAAKVKQAVEAEVQQQTRNADVEKSTEESEWQFHPSSVIQSSNSASSLKRSQFQVRMLAMNIPLDGTPHSINRVVQRVKIGGQHSMQRHEDFMYLQRTIGNQATGQLVYGMQNTRGTGKTKPESKNSTSEKVQTKALNKYGGAIPIQKLCETCAAENSDDNDANTNSIQMRGKPSNIIQQQPATPSEPHERKNTELGGLIVGNFDYKFDGNTIEVTSKVKFEFEDGISAAQQTQFKAKFFNAITNYWSNSGYALQGTGTCPSNNVPINISSIEVTSDYHKLVDVEKEHRRASVISDMNLWLGIGEQTIAHEFGHVLGLYDEYDGGWFENMMFWHDDDSHQSDTNALMNTGGELRDRYFDSFLKESQSKAQTGCTYSIASPLPTP